MTAPSIKTILIVDDELDIADLLEVYLKNEGYQVIKAASGQAAQAAMDQYPIDLAILDIMLPDTTGFQLCQAIRAQKFFPIIMLTAKSEDMDKITGLTVGADDYMTKPFNPLEMVARVRTQLRRFTQYNTRAQGQEPNIGADPHNSPYHGESHRMEINGLEICKASRKAKVYKTNLSLTPLEFDILWHLCVNKGKVVTSEELFEAVWGDKFLDNNNTVMAHIARIREKMKEQPRKPKFIKTVWGVGYTIEDE